MTPAAQRASLSRRGGVSSSQNKLHEQQQNGGTSRRAYATTMLHFAHANVVQQSAGPALRPRAHPLPCLSTSRTADVSRSGRERTRTENEKRQGV
eukprot:6183173-Pleurochrysis_carterae.AAC.1